MWGRHDVTHLVYTSGSSLSFTTTPLQLISECMAGGDMMDHVERILDSANRFGLAGAPSLVFHPILTLVTSFTVV